MDVYTINPGDYVVVQRQNYTKLHKIKAHGTINLGSYIIELDNAIGAKYMSTFQMVLKEGSKRLYTVEKVEEINSVTQLNITQSGKDNRNITPHNQSQTLTRDDITSLRNKDCSSNDIVERLIENSSTFTSKTEYSQEKYLKKKVKKYFEYIQIRKPTLRLLTQMFYRQDPQKTLGMRVDDLSQVITYSNIQNEGIHLLYDSGTSGLVAAALLNAIGSETNGRLVHMHPGNECQKTALDALQFPQEQRVRCVNVNLYSVLRCYYQRNQKTEIETETNENVETPGKRKLNDVSNEPPAKRPHWQYENERACQLLDEKVDSLVIVSKDHPVKLTEALLGFLKGGRNLVVFSTTREPLQDLYVYLKGRHDFLCVRLIGNFLREHQVLPERTHPEVNMNFGGHLLTAVKLDE